MLLLIKKALHAIFLMRFCPVISLTIAIAFIKKIFVMNAIYIVYDVVDLASILLIVGVQCCVVLIAFFKIFNTLSAHFLHIYHIYTDETHIYVEK
jgi:hypothetical protein